LKNEDKAIEFLMSVKAEAIKAAFGICALPEKELFQRLEMLYMNGVDAGVKLGAERAREDALEAAIVTGGIWVQAAYIAQFNASLRALKTQGDAQ